MSNSVCHAQPRHLQPGARPNVTAARRTEPRLDLQPAEILRGHLPERDKDSKQNHPTRTSPARLVFPCQASRGNAVRSAVTCSCKNVRNGQVSSFPNQPEASSAAFRSCLAFSLTDRCILVRLVIFLNSAADRTALNYALGSSPPAPRRHTSERKSRT